ncbi:hypothetical protein JM18_004756 [Phytophthora kernoviae]|uniref:Cytochrome b5 heme-binding domain-containing protein n=1 Tax=Phytophthora kernoviae TaxID=325452 RepID=A0A8T0LXH4_9STRA|nr:hypothetical protein JM16_005324 [Phytophthora kernoviae]KAG2525301.1 hypothetical protein JM18_004756 [Phytophthora kernoviae]
MVHVGDVNTMTHQMDTDNNNKLHTRRAPPLDAAATSSSTKLYTSNQAELVAKMKTFDLEELGLTAVSVVKEEKRLVVDYEDNYGDHLELRNDSATCAPDACGLLEDKALTGLSEEVVCSGRLSRRRSRHGSDMASAPTSSLRGKSVIFEQGVKTEEPVSPSTSATDEEEETTRCSKVHKLCLCEVQLHRSMESCWLVSSGQVYDVTGLVTAHPGGTRSILRKAGGPDCTRDMKFHTKKARKMMEKCFIGKLQACGDEVDCSGEANCNIM